MSTDYDLIVIGGGATGLTAAGVSANLGARTLLIEQARLGGDCTWHGCIPSKALLSTAHVAHVARKAGRFGVHTGEVSVNFPEVMAHMRALREKIYEDADTPERYEGMGVDVRQGQARFVDSRTIEITLKQGGANRLSARRFVIATGAAPFIPPIRGIDEAGYLTNETIFEQTEQPGHLMILGGGPVGTEMAQAFHRLGSNVTVIDRQPRILHRDDEELARLMQKTLEGEGVRFAMQAHVSAIRVREGLIEILFQHGRASLRETSPQTATRETLCGDALLVATGRSANVAHLGLEAAGVAFDERGIHVDDRCRTTQRGIYAAGDVTGRFAFTHVGEHAAKVAVMNALLRMPSKIDGAHLTWATYADPELAHVGATETQLREWGIRYETLRFPYDKIDRAVIDGEDTGWIKVHARPRDGKIFGASILGARAGDLICEFALAMRRGIRLRHISDTIHPYPSYGLGVRRTADQWYVRRRTPGRVRLIKRLLGYRGPVIEYDPEEIV